MAIILFHWTYALDLTFLYLAEVNEEEVKERKMTLLLSSSKKWVFGIFMPVCPTCLLSIMHPTCVFYMLSLCFLQSVQHCLYVVTKQLRHYTLVVFCTCHRMQRVGAYERS